MLADFQPVLANKRFVRLWTSQLLSQLTIHMVNFVFLIKLFSTTGSTIATSLLWIAYALPAILIGPIAAGIVDILDRRLILIITNLFQSLIIFFFAVSQGSSPFLIYGIAMSYAFLNQFYVPAEAASLPSVVDRAHLTQANSIFFLTQQGALIIGYATAGLVNHFVGFSTSLYIASALLFLACVSVWSLPKLKPENNLPKNIESGIMSFFANILSGYTYIKENRSILAPFLILLFCQIELTIVAINVPILVTNVFDYSVNTGAVFVVTAACLGAAGGSLAINKILKRGKRKKKIIEAGFIALSLAFGILAFLIPMVEGFVRFIIGSVAVFLTGVGFIGIVIPAQTFLQEKTPGGLRGRVFGNFWFLATIATIFPVIFSGTISELLGIKFFLFLLASVSVTGFFLSKNYGQKFLMEG